MSRQFDAAVDVALEIELELRALTPDLAAHKARIAELEAKRKELYDRFPSTWGHNDLHIGKITSDGAALITFAKAPGEVPLHPFATAGERLIEYLLAPRADARLKTVSAPSP